jgi:hypothetical protein
MSPFRRIAVTALIGLMASIGTSNGVYAGVLSLPPAAFALSADGLSAASPTTIANTFCEPAGPDNAILCTTATASASVTPAVHISGNGYIGAGASAGVTYYIAILGTDAADPNSLAMVDYSTSGGASGGTASQATTSIAGAFGGVACSGTDDCGDTPSAFSISGTFMAQSCDLAVNNCGSSFGITVAVTADTSGDDGAFSAYADPYIYIDPTFLASNPGYSVVVSAGIDNAPISAVPEPCALAIFGVALVGIGMMRGQRRAPASV